MDSNGIHNETATDIAVQRQSALLEKEVTIQHC